MKFSVVIFVLCGQSVSAGFFADEEKPRQLDGSLRCYQCTSASEDICTLSNWKHANVTEKRFMIMQCPRRKSAFCHLALTEGSNSTVRGCSGPKYEDGRVAHVGCFSMARMSGEVSRVCLCDTQLCNSGRRTGGVVALALALAPVVHLVM